MGHCFTQMSLSDSQERAIGSGTHHPEGSWQSVAFRIGGETLGEQWLKGTLTVPVCNESKNALLSVVKTKAMSYRISLPQKLQGTLA